MPVILIVGATRGLGASLVKLYASNADNYVLATARTSNPPANSMFRNLPELGVLMLITTRQERGLHTWSRHRFA